jgi:hypothetical protein
VHLQSQGVQSGATGGGADLKLNLQRLIQNARTLHNRSFPDVHGKWTVRMDKPRGFTAHKSQNVKRHALIPGQALADRLGMRSEDRELCADLVKIQWKPESGPDCNEWAILEDISASGACFESEQPIPPETVVSLQFKGDHCLARVKYCKFDQINYMVGVHFEEGYRWSRRRFKPDHLLQFRLRGVSKKSKKSE